MDALKRTWDQFTTLFRAMSPSQRLTLLAVPLVLLCAFGVLVWQHQSSSETPLAWGKVFPVDQLRQAEQTLIEAGLNEFRTSGQRIFVPAAQVEQYNAALLVDGNLPSESLSEFERQFEKTSVFSSREQLQTMKEIALRNELRQVLRAVPDIEDASVTWARSEARRWPERSTKVTATVSLQPRRGQSLDSRMVRSVRAAVASMIADLAPEDVTVFDQGSGIAYTTDRDGQFDGELLRWIDQHTEHYHRQISAALAYIPGAIVSVSVDVENLKRQVVREQKVDSKATVAVQTGERTLSVSTTERLNSGEPGATSNTPRQLQTQSAPSRASTTEESDTASRVVPSFTITEKEFLSAMPQAVQVSISIPEDYYERVALARGQAQGATDEEKAAFRAAVATIRTEEEAKVRKHAATLIPVGSPETAVNVTSVTRLPQSELDTSLPMTARLTIAARDWAGPVTLAALAGWGLLLLSRSAGKTAAEKEEEDAKPTVNAEGETVGAEPNVPPLSRRDVLQNAVKDNPEIAAAVIGKWLQASKN